MVLSKTRNQLRERKDLIRLKLVYKKYKSDKKTKRRTNEQTSVFNRDSNMFNIISISKRFNHTGTSSVQIKARIQIQ